MENRTILAGFDSSPNAEKAVYFALRLAAALRGNLLLVFVVRPYVPEAEFPPVNPLEILEAERQAAEQALKKMQAKLDAKGVDLATEVVLGNPAAEIARISEKPEVETVVVGRSGKGAVARLLLGSVALTLARSCPKPLVIVP